MPRFKLLIEYDGTRYCGWQRQNDEPSIQEEIERALSTALGHELTVVGSGRTDAGVHARGQVAHFDSDRGVDPYRLRGSLNGLLPDDIAILDAASVDDGFHARYDAVARLYRYYVTTRGSALERFYRQPVPEAIDFDLMNRCASALAGEHDFSSFCRTQSETKNRVCSISKATWMQESRPHNHFFEIEGDRFLHGMVRAIVGTLLEISRGMRPPDSLPGVLGARDRRKAGESAPARGLVLESVRYAGEWSSLE